MIDSPQILFVGHSGSRTGAPMVLLYFLDWLKKNSKITFEILLREGGALESEFSKVSHVHSLIQRTGPENRGIFKELVKRLHKSFKMQSQLETFCKIRRWDLVYSNTITNGEIVALAAKCGCPVITHVHEMDYWIQRGGQKNWEQVKRQTTHFIAASKAVKENLINSHGVQPERVSVVHEFIKVAKPLNNGETAAQIRKKLGIPENAFILGGSGAEFWRKGRDLIVHLLMIIKQRAPDNEIHFLWVGQKGSPLEEIEFWHDLKIAQVADRCHVTGEVANPLDYFSAMNVFALLSREDPFPLVCLEAGSLGKPIICFADAGGIPELVEDDSGYIVPYLNVEAMAERVLHLSKNPEECYRLGQIGAKKIESKFSVEVLSPKILEVIERVGGFRHQ